MSEISMSTDHTVAVFSTHDAAESAVKLLSASGYDMRRLSIVGQNYATEEHPIGFVNTGNRMLTWGKYGVFWGSIWGLLFGSAMLVIPGIGTLLFAGWIVAALEGAVLGGGAAALVGALVSIGIPENSVVHYERELKAGSFLLIANGDAAETAKAKEILANTLAVRIDSFSKKPASVGV